jgi:hypothetical protein
MSKLTRRAPMPKSVASLRACAGDPMWADHAEVSKALLSKAADDIEALVVELCHAQMEAAGACAELSSAVLHDDATYAIRDSKCAAHTLVTLQKRISDFIDARAA